MFEGFEDDRIGVGEVTLRVRHGGAGPAILLIHGHLRTGATWYKVAPRLAGAGFSVVCPDMRGYGESTSPAPLPDHAQQSKRAVAADLTELMGRLGHDRFSVVGHDRGCYVAHRLAVDHPGRVSRLVVMDGVPISEALDRCDARFARDWYHWFFFAQPDKPERAINIDPEAWYGGDPLVMGRENHAEFLLAIRDPQTVLAMLEDYRAGLSIDQHDERADRSAGRRAQCPTLLVWSSKDDLGEFYRDPVAVWRKWIHDIRGLVLNSGHHMAEECPDDLADALTGFLTPP